MCLKIEIIEDRIDILVSRQFLVNEFWVMLHYSKFLYYSSVILFVCMTMSWEKTNY